MTSLVLVPGIVAPAYAAPAALAETAKPALESDPYRAEKTELFNRINDYRIENGVEPLTSNPAIATVAQNWSTKTADAGGFKHNPDFASQIPSGWSAAGENIAADDSPEAIFLGWVSSEGHRLNMLDSRFTEIGIGYAYQGNPKGEYPGTYYATTNFAAYPLTVTAAPPIFAAANYTIPDVQGIQYTANGEVKAAGMYPGTGTVTVTARAKPGYVLAAGSTAEWTATLKTEPHAVTPAAVTFSDQEGSAEDTFTVPATEGVEYLVGGKVVAAGTHPGAGTVTVTARAKTDYRLASGAVSEWTTTFKTAPIHTATPIDAKYDSIGGAATLGLPKGPEVGNGRDKGAYRDYERGTIYWSEATGAHVNTGGIRSVYASQGWETGFLGYPTTDEVRGLRDGGAYQSFQGGTIYWSPSTGAHINTGGIRAVYASQGWENGFLGYPTTGEIRGLRNGGVYQSFQGGTIYWSPTTGARINTGAIRGAYASQGWENGYLGYPTTDEVRGLRNGGAYQSFQGGTVYWSPGTGAQINRGAIRTAYASQGWENGWLGYPVTGEYPSGGGTAQDFQGGRISWTPGGGAVATRR
ncbi:uncharacterized protein with LGFP repeats [Arthrobacter sp. PvP023]|uniref:CAP domain-containing protein n=1 Tax=Micrococcaceae TaxID=1268 RepID=UPI001AE8D574|nr:CAP domain-containing protein [Arthrobacter sp. PvP023]MBP1135130.1 uncharacterized protein with LGFP repeats [Arthrobacter sp. PvP023]